jgi:hypothetical protein
VVVVFLRNFNLYYYKIKLYYDGSLNNYVDANYYNILKDSKVNWYITIGAKVSIDIIKDRYKYFIYHMNFINHYFLLPLLYLSFD